jgi:hypothetical protein
MINRIQGRLKTAATIDDINQTIEKALDNVLIEKLKDACNEIDYEYDDGVFNLVCQSPEYMGILDGIKDVVSNALDEMDRVVEDWKDNTVENYSNYNDDVDETNYNPYTGAEDFNL